MSYFSSKNVSRHRFDMVLAAVLICVGYGSVGASGFVSQDTKQSVARPEFSGQWQQNNERCVPTPRNKAAVYRLGVEVGDTTLHVLIHADNGRGERTLDLNYEIGGKELVYTGLDGDEYHTKVAWTGDSLVFTTVEHERGRLIPSQETWTLIDSGKSLQRTKIVNGSDEDSKSVYVLERGP